MFYEYDTNWLVDIRVRTNGLGQYGWDTGFELSVEIDDELLSQVDVSDTYLKSLEQFVSAVQDELVAVVESEQEQSQFSSKEFAALMLYKREMVSENEAADALDVTVGTYRGKLGRIREKIAAAELTEQLLGEFEAHNERVRESSGYRAYGDLVSIHDAEDYPVSESDHGNQVRHHIQNIIDLLEHDNDAAYYDSVIERAQDRLEISYYRARYELERAIDKDLVVRDGNTVTRPE
ncbi:hypothetical protein C480_09960 [Natrialba aegyptia DSM 13077]|uniref:Uncharacterized protein n=1 Tax=Natrialba aegyptia DSM 13077 TaxID=1227491 RepID=M0B618_9EURY|nr:hypothetical protein C480_09960 [Natrialba aegyptia DSM 13077]